MTAVIGPAPQASATLNTDPPKIVDVDPVILPDQKPPWYQVLVGYRTVFTIALSSLLKLLAARGILDQSATGYANDITDLVFLILSFVADGLSIWFKLRSTGPGQLADPKAVTAALVKRAETDSQKLVDAIDKANELIKQAQIAASRAELARQLKQGTNK
jgi:hypothetical protein